MKLTKAQKYGLICIDECNSHLLNKQTVNSLYKAGYIDKHCGEYDGLTNLGIVAIEHARYQEQRERLLTFDTQSLIGQLEMAFEHSFYIDWDYYKEEPDSCRDEWRYALLRKRFPSIQIY